MAGSVSELYDTLFVPLTFEPCAADLATRVVAPAPTRVLETAAGTGVLTRAMARSLPAHVQPLATALNQPMLDHAATVGTPRLMARTPHGRFDSAVEAAQAYSEGTLLHNKIEARAGASLAEATAACAHPQSGGRPSVRSARCTAGRACTRCR